MKIHDVYQGTPEWLLARCGKLTASRFDAVLAKGVGKAPSKTRQSYLYEVASEILTGQPQDSYTNDAMAYGTLTEPEARQTYANVEQVPVGLVGFVEMNERVGCSPDGFIGTNGLLEIKCPKTSTQIQRVLASVFPSEYLPQVQGQLWVCEREWCDFLSYDGRINGPASYFKVRVYRDEQYIKTLSDGVSQFIEELEKTLERLQNAATNSGRIERTDVISVAS